MTIYLKSLLYFVSYFFCFSLNASQKCPPKPQKPAQINANKQTKPLSATSIAIDSLKMTPKEFAAESAALQQLLAYKNHFRASQNLTHVAINYATLTQPLRVIHRQPAVNLNGSTKQKKVLPPVPLFLVKK